MLNKITFRHIVSFLFFLMLLNSSSLLASHELQVKEKLCFERIFGSFIVEPINNVVWYKKIAIYSKNTFQWSDNGQKNFVPEFHGLCRYVVVRYVPLSNNQVPQEEELLNVASMAITKPLIINSNHVQTPINDSERHSKDGLMSSALAERFQSGAGKLTKEMEYTRYFHRKRDDEPYGGQRHVQPWDIDDNNKLIYTVPRIGAYLFLDSVPPVVGDIWKPNEIVRHLGGEHTGGDIVDEKYNVHSFIDNPVALTANNCWLMQPFVKKNKCNNVIERSSTKVHKSLRVFSLRSSDPIDDYRCKKINDGGAESQPSFELNDPSDCENSANYDNPGSVGLDYDYLSTSPNELELVYQQGYLNSSISEKYLEGALVYNKLVRVESDTSSQEINVNLEVEKDISKICHQQDRYLGWISNPSFSLNGKIVFFLALSEKGHDASRNDIYSFIKSKLHDQFDCRQDVNNLTRIFDFDEPIRRFKVSSDLSLLTVIYEKRGGSIVRFFKLDPGTGKVTQKYPYDLEWPGFISDVVQMTSGLEKGSSFYIMASTLNVQTSIYTCFLLTDKFQCNDKPHPRGRPYNFEDLMSLQKVDTGRTIGLSREPIYSKDNDVYVDTFVFTPSNPAPNCTAIVSIHGGPNEAWDGRFARMEYMLAKQGYTVYMPNPSGSTGYGFGYSGASRYNWGTRIYDDIKNVVKHISDKKKHCSIVVKGFSFGGYMINWIQTRPEEDKEKYFKDVDTYVAINPAYDLRDFAYSTDQYWFPQYQLGCSGQECRNLDACKIPGNPACYSYNLAKGKITPTLLAAGCYDRRIPVHDNTVPMESAYLKHDVPYQVIDSVSGHGFGLVQDHEYSIRIHKWILEVANLRKNNENPDDLSCQTPNNRFYCDAENNPFLLTECSG
jgi:dipeptidyl aminopeptidase/acylaminoacyl peptidase